LGLKQRLERGAEPLRGVTAAIGDRMVFDTALDHTHVELRIYQSNRRVVLRCPGDAGCKSDGHTLHAEYKISGPGSYRALLLRANVDIPPPAAGGLDADLNAVEAIGGTAILGDLTEVH